MNKDQFNILPNYINKKFEVVESKHNVKSIDIKSEDVTDLTFDTSVSDDEWIIYLNGKYNYEYPSKKFWCKPEFTIRPQSPNVVFKYLFLKLSIPNIINNKLIVTSHDKIVFETNRLDEDIDVILSYNKEYTFNSLPFIPTNSCDKRTLGSYITNIKIVDCNNFIYPVPPRNIITFDYDNIFPFIA